MFLCEIYKRVIDFFTKKLKSSSCKVDIEDEQQKDYTLLRYVDKPVTSFMVTRDQILALPVGCNSKEVLSVFAKSKFTRIPVYENNLDNIVGFIHIKDMVANLDSDFKASDIMRSAYSVPDSIKMSELMFLMKKSKSHAVIVVDEYGGTDGLATFSDLIEALIGEKLDDEHTTEKKPLITISQVTENVFELKGRALIADVEEKLGIKLTDSEGFYTVGGLIFELIDRIPTEGEIISDPETKIEFKIISAGDRAIKLVRMDISKYTKIEEEDPSAD